MNKNSNPLALLGLLTGMAGAAGMANGAPNPTSQLMSDFEVHKILMGVQKNDPVLLEIQDPMLLALRLTILEEMGLIAPPPSAKLIAVLTEAGTAKLAELNQRYGENAFEPRIAEPNQDFDVGDPVSVPTAGEQWNTSNIIQIFEDGETGQRLIKVQNTEGARLLTEEDNVVALTPVKCDCPSCVGSYTSSDDDGIYRSLSIKGTPVIEDGLRKYDMVFGVQTENTAEALPPIRADARQLTQLIKTLADAVDAMTE